MNSGEFPVGFRANVRRVVLGVLLLGVSPLAACPADDPGDGKPMFSRVDERFPVSDSVWQPTLPQEPPAGTIGTVYGYADNFWALAPADAKGIRRVLVLPAQDRSAWVEPDADGLPPADWQWIQPDENGFVWVASKEHVLRLDPRHPDRGWQSFSADSAFPEGRIVALAAGPRGSVVVALNSGQLVELDRLPVPAGDIRRERNRILAVACPASVNRIRADGRGRIWLNTAEGVFRSGENPFGGSSVPDAEQPSTAEEGAYWKLVARMPCCNHDLSGDVMGGRFYVGGGLTNARGFPAVDHDFSSLFEFDGATHRWRIAADLGRGRVYCTTSHLDGRVWIIGGDVFEDDGSRTEMTWVQIADPATGHVIDGPPTAVARPMPIAHHINGRIYVVGNPRNEPDKPAQIESIGSGESEWRKEPDGPPGFGPLAGCALNDRLYIAVPERFLAVFDTTSRQWSTIDVPWPPRSCQMAAFRGDIWLMGGRGVPGGSATQIYSPATGKWRSGPALPRELSWGAAADVNGVLVVTGGAGQHGHDWTYNNRTWILSD